MAGPQIKSGETGPGVYRFLVGDALLECRRNIHDDERFATSVEWALAVSQDIIQKHDKWWNTAMTQVLLDEQGQPLVDGKGKWLNANVEIPKISQYKRIAALTVLLRKTGILNRQPEHYENATGFFNEVMQERAKASEGTESSEDDEEEED